MTNGVWVYELSANAFHLLWRLPNKQPDRPAFKAHAAITGGAFARQRPTCEDRPQETVKKNCLDFVRAKMAIHNSYSNCKVIYAIKRFKVTGESSGPTVDPFLFLAISLPTPFQRIVSGGSCDSASATIQPRNCQLSCTFAG